MGKVGKLRMIWAMFKLYLNNPNYYVRQDDVLADLFMQGEYDVERFCHSLGPRIYPHGLRGFEVWLYYA